MKYSHVVLFALLPLVNFYATNSQELSIGDPEVFQFLVFNLIVMGVAFGVSYLLLRNLPKAAILTTIFVTFFFLFGHLADLFKGFAIPSLSFGPMKLLFLFYIGAVGISFILLRKSKPESSYKLSRVLSLIGVFIVAIPLLQTISKEAKQQSYDVKGANSENSVNVASETANLPDVYYMVLDSYPRSDTLKDLFDYDNSDFMNKLKEKGFYVADNSNSNYAFTTFSIPSTMNMRYHDLGNMSPDDLAYEGPSLDLENSNVIRNFKSLGYKFVHIGSGWNGSKELYEAADVEIEGSNNDQSVDLFGLRVDLNEFLVVYSRTTAFRPLLDNRLKKGLSNSVLDAFDAVSKVPDVDGPTFAFIHMMVPHPPYIFDEKGPIETQQLELISDATFRDKKNQLAQLKFTNKLALEAMDKVLSESDNPPIIVLASDHGTATQMGHPDNWSEPNEDNKEGIKERFANFAAFYFPDQKYEKLKPDMTPVNFFPTIFDQYFGGSYEIQPDKIFYSNYKDRLKFIDVTDIVRPNSQ